MNHCNLACFMKFSMNTVNNFVPNYHDILDPITWNDKLCVSPPLMSALDIHKKNILISCLFDTLNLAE